MRLITKINIYFGIILAILMISIFSFTFFYFHQELEAQMENSLRVTYESFKLTLANVINEQILKAAVQTKRDIIGLSTKDRIASVLNYYLNLAAKDYKIDLLEVTDPNYFLIADSNQLYEPQSQQSIIKKPTAESTISYLTRRNHQLFLFTTSEIYFSGELVGYLSIGTLIDNKLANYFASILHSRLIFYTNQQFLTGNAPPIKLNSVTITRIKKNPPQGVFISGSKLNNGNYDYIFFPLPSDSGFTGIVGIAKNRSDILNALLRLKLFLLILTGLGFVFGFVGAISLAQNIKKSIFGMEPREIASLLNQRTTILQSTFEGIIALDQNGLITLINKEAKRLLPTNLEMIGQPAEVFFRDLNIHEILSSGQAIYNQQQVIGETVIVYNCVPIKTKLGIIGAVVTLRDLTEFQKVAEELVEVKNYTQALRAQSHEFMNKLQSISGLIQLERYETALTLLHETTESHQDLLSFLANSFSTSAVSGILLGKFNRAKELNIKFEIDRTSYIPKEAIVSDHELVCIVGNLIENAFEALQDSNQTLKLVRVRIRPWRNCLRITITNNGPAIPKNIRQKIFERGFTSKKGQNKGIGLSLVNQSVENLRGIIRLRSGKQTTFTVRVPLKMGGQTLEN